MATSQVIPKLTLNFTAATLDPIISFTRSGNTATVTDSLGAIVLVNENTPRFNYLNGVCNGLLIEDSRTNVLINSVFSGAVTPSVAPTSWTFAFSTGTFVSVSSGTYASGNKLSFTCTAARSVIQQTYTLSANTIYAISLTANIASNTDGTVTSFVNWNGTSASIVRYVDGVVVSSGYIVPTGIRKLTVVVSIGGANSVGQVRVGVGCNQNVTSVASIEMPQVEAGTFSTSYIPTTVLQVTRNVDVATITGENFSNFWQTSKGGAQVQTIPSTVSGIRPLVQFDDGTANEIIALRGNAADPELYIIDGGTPQAQLDAGTIAANTAYSLTGWWATNDCKARQDSGAVVTDTTATIPTVTQMRIGSDGTNYLNGTIATIDYYDSFFGRPIYTRRKNKVFPSLL
jgi:hypothetical protein